MEMQRQAAMVQLPDGSGRTVEIRIGIHSGPLISGVVGSIRKRYTVIGSTVNIASRCEQLGYEARINLIEGAPSSPGWRPPACRTGYTSVASRTRS